MIFKIKKLTPKEKTICKKTIGSKAIYALIGDALARKKSVSLIRVADGERAILETKDAKTFTYFEKTMPGWNKKYGVEDMPLDRLQAELLEAGNTCTFFAPSVSGISLPHYNLYDLYKPRRMYIDNFFADDWTKEMIEKLFNASKGVFILHREHEDIIKNFQKNYNSSIRFSGAKKDSWKDNDDAINAAIQSDAQLILFSGGPAGKIIGPKIAAAKNKIVLDIGHALLPWSEKVV